MKRVTAKIITCLILGSVLLMISINPSASADYLPTADEIIEKYITALGGRTALAKLINCHYTGQMITDLKSEGSPTYEMHGYEIYSALPDNYLYLEHTDGGVEKEGFNGQNGWKQTHNCITDSDNDADPKMRWLVNPRHSLLTDKFFPQLKFDKKIMIDSKEVYVLVPKDLPAKYYALHFDTKSGLLVRIGNWMSVSDYREIDGILFPGRISFSRKGGSITYELKDLKYNLDLDENLFKRPEK